MSDRIAYVRYTHAGTERRVGPLKFEFAEAAAKEFARKPQITDVVLEWYECTRKQSVSQ